MFKQKGPKQFLSVLSVATAMLFAVPVSALALVVDYDNSFSTDGFGFVNNYPTIETETTYDSIVQSDGKFVIVGSHYPTALAKVEGVVRRYGLDGTPDSGFGTSGVVSLDIGTYGTTALDGVALQPDGKIIVSGDIINTSAAPAGYDYDAFVARLNTDGTLDTSFSTDGYAMFDGMSGVPLSKDSFRDVAVAGDGDILLAGSSGSNALIMRLSDDGTIDTGFGTSGVVTNHLSGGGGVDFYVSLAVDSVGSIFTTGWEDPSSGSPDVVVSKYSAAGVPVGSFSGDGHAIFDGLGGVAADYDQGQLVEVDGTSVIISGSTRVSGSAMVTGFLMKLQPDGSLDTDFATNGVFVLPGGDWFEGLEVTDDFYYLAGSDFRDPSGMADSSIWRFTTDGALDTSFDGDGQFKLLELNNFTNTWGILYGISVLGNQIFVAGTPFDDDTYVEITGFAKLLFGNEVTNIPAGTGLTDTTGGPISSPLSGLQTVQLENTTLGVPVVEFSADFDSGNVDLSGVVVDTSIVDGKSVVSGLIGTHTIFVPKRPGDVSVIICPDAQTLSQVAPGCTNQQIYVESSPNVDVVNISGQDFWKVSGLTGTGGISSTIVLGVLSPTGSNLIPLMILCFAISVIGYSTKFMKTDQTK